jgi:hypothetical protein
VVGAILTGQFWLTPTVLNSAGTSSTDIAPRVNVLRANGIGGILDYAAEADVQEADSEHVDVLDHPKWAAEGGAQVNCFSAKNIVCLFF